jgi:hypothetical protein
MENKNNKLPIQHYKRPVLRRTYFLIGLIVGYTPYVIHQEYIWKIL